MQVFLIEESSQKSFLKSIFKKVQILEDKIILNCECDNMKIKKQIKLIDNVANILKINNVKNIIISEKLSKNNQIVNLFYSKGLNIIEGKGLFKKLIVQIIEVICSQNKIKPYEKQISIAVNGTSIYCINVVKELSKKFKTLNIVTNNINFFKPLKEQIWEEDGIIITLTNNKKKALAKSDLILNIDFPEEQINKYTIYDEGILINLEEKIKIKKKRFCGKIINDYKIQPKKNTMLEEFLNDEKYAKFNKNAITEVYIMNHPEEIKNIICK